jgi:hypothetical protein
MKKINPLIIIALIVIPIALVAGSYAFFFGNINNRSLSVNPEQWGQFGDFFGGTLNPIYALLAFVGVLITIHLQAKQLELAEKRALIEEVQRLIFNVSMEIDSLLKQSLKVTPAEFADKPHPFTVSLLISAIGTSVLNKHPNAQEMKQKSLHCIKLEIGHLIIELQQLVQTIEKYKLIGGNEIIIDFYKKRYQVYVCWLHVLGSADGSQDVMKFFKPQELVVSLKELAATEG